MDVEYLKRMFKGRFLLKDVIQVSKDVYVVSIYSSSKDGVVRIIFKDRGAFVDVFLRFNELKSKTPEEIARTSKAYGTVCIAGASKEEFTDCVWLMVGRAQYSRLYKRY